MYSSKYTAFAFIFLFNQPHVTIIPCIIVCLKRGYYRYPLHDNPYS